MSSQIQKPISQLGAIKKAKMKYYQTKSESFIKMRMKIIKFLLIITEALVSILENNTLQLKVFICTTVLKQFLMNFKMELRTIILRLLIFIDI
jgi:hypothetical protein